MSNIYKIIFLIIAITVLSCNTPYKKITPASGTVSEYHNGKAVITEITDSADDYGTINRGYVAIYFNFVPSDADSAKKYLCMECSDNRIKLFYDNRESFHLNWVKRWEIQPGSSYPAIRHEIRRKDNSSAVSYEVFLEPNK